MKTKYGVLNDPLLNFKNIKYDDVHDIAKQVESFNLHEVRKSITYYPCVFFGDSVQAYIYCFNHAVVFYTGLAIEIGLMIRLKPLIEKEQEQRHKNKFAPKLKWLIDNSEAWLSYELRQKAEKLRMLRNCYTHYENIIAHTAWLDQVVHPQLTKELLTSFNDNEQDYKNLASFLTKLDDYREKVKMFTVRFEFLELNKENMSFNDKRYEEYLAWLPTMWAVKKTQLTQQVFGLLYGVESFDALTCIKLSYEILESLKFI
jgi:hypothetical protein